MGFASESRERSRPVLPLAGMVDILFLLLIFFMSTYSLRDQELSVDVGLPSSEVAAPGDSQALRVIVSFDKEGQVYLGSRAVTIEQLRGEMVKLAEVSLDQPVVIRGDPRAPMSYGLAHEIMEAAQLAGFTQVEQAVAQEE